MKQKLTVRSVRDLQPAEHDVVLWDTDLTGFGCKVTPAGRKTFFYYYRTNSGQQRRPRIGEFGSIQPEAARAVAQSWAATVAQGGDPSKDRAKSRATPTIAQLADRYLEDHAEAHKASSSVANDKRLLSKRILPAAGSKKLDAITRSDIASLHKSLRKTPYEANRTLALLSRMFSLAEQWELMPAGSNPAKGVRRYKEEKRERYLSAEELKRLWTVLHDVDAEQLASASEIRVLKLTILTGRRVGEVQGMRWSDIDFEQRIIRYPRSKTGRLTMPLAEFTAAYLREEQQRTTSPFVCPGRDPSKPLVNIQKPWRKIRARAGLTDLRIHDLRHSYGNLGADSGMSLLILGRLLGHSQTATTERYAHLAQDPVRDAANSIEEEILRRLSAG